jgi:DNA-binding beta-propeller fold protein YncE
VTNIGLINIAVINAIDNSLMKNIKMEETPVDVAVDHNNNLIYVANYITQKRNFILLLTKHNDR